MFQNFFATLLTGFALIAGTLAHDVVQLPNNAAELVRPYAITSLSYSRHTYSGHPAAAAASQSSNIPQSDQATLSEEVKQAEFPPPASTQGGATATSLAVSTKSSNPQGRVLGESTAPAQSSVYRVARAEFTMP
jgi:hypothetical protein